MSRIAYKCTYRRKENQFLIKFMFRALFTSRNCYICTVQQVIFCDLNDFKDVAYFLYYLQRRWLYLKAGFICTNLPKVSAATNKVLAANQCVRQG